MTSDCAAFFANLPPSAIISLVGNLSLRDFSFAGMSLCEIILVGNSSLRDFSFAGMSLCELLFTGMQVQLILHGHTAAGTVPALHRIPFSNPPSRPDLDSARMHQLSKRLCNGFDDTKPKIVRQNGSGSP